MDIQLKEINKRDFNKFKKNYIDSIIRSVSDKNYEGFIHSFYFSNKGFSFVRYIDIDNINLIKKFFNVNFVLNEKNIVSIWNNDFGFKLDKLLLKIVLNNPKEFIFDKRLSIYAKRILMIDYLKDNLSSYRFLSIDNKNVNIVHLNNSHKKAFYSNLEELNFQFPLNDKFLKKCSAGIFNAQPNQTNKQLIFGKDIINSILKVIKEGSFTYEDLLINEAPLIDIFLNKKSNENDFYKQEIIDIFNKKLYLRQRKTKLSYTSITKKNFKSIFISYIHYYLTKSKKSFIDYLINDLKIKGYFSNENLKLIEAGLNICNLSYLKNNFRHLELEYPETADLAMDNFLILTNKKKDFSKFINPKKYSFKTKQILLQTNIYYFISLNEAENHLKYVISYIDSLKEINISEKHIRGFLSKFLNTNNFIDIDNEFLNTHKLNFVFGHFLKILINTLHSMKNKNIFHKFFNLLINIQAHDEVLSNAIKALDFLKTFENKLIDYNFKNIKTFLSDIELIKNIHTKEELQKLSKDFNFNEDFFDYVKSMNVFIPVIKEFKNIKSSPNYFKDYLENNYLEEDLILNKNNFNIGIFKHNSNIGILGSNVKGVCISSYGEDRLSQINKNFLNLCIYNKSQGVFLWGLLCRAEDKETKEVFYILNNLQGSNNRNNVSSEEVRDSIFEIFNMIKTKLNIKEVLFKNQYFNSISLISSKKMILKDSVNLCKQVRLDFNIKENFYVAK